MFNWGSKFLNVEGLGLGLGTKTKHTLKVVNQKLESEINLNFLESLSISMTICLTIRFS